jgi:hypothetical protein
MKLRPLLRLLFGRSEPPPEAEHAPSTPITPEDEFDETLDRLYRKINQPISDLKGDGRRLERLIKRIEKTSNDGVLAMRGNR